MNPAVDRLESPAGRGRRSHPALAGDPGRLRRPARHLRLPGPPGGPADHPGVREPRVEGPGLRPRLQGVGEPESGVPGPEHKYHITADPDRPGVEHPLEAGRRRGRASRASPSASSSHLLAAITILALTFFFLLDGRQQGERLLSRMSPDTATRMRRIAIRIAGVVKSYVSVNLLLAIAAGVFTWLVLELLGVDLAVTMGVIVGFFDLVPLIGFTVGGLLRRDRGRIPRLPRRADRLAGAVPRLPAGPGPGDPAAPVQERRAGPSRRGDRRDPGRRASWRGSSGRCSRSRRPPRSAC